MKIWSHNLLEWVSIIFTTTTQGIGLYTILKNILKFLLPRISKWSALKLFPLNKDGILINPRTPTIYFYESKNVAEINITPQIRNFSGYDIEIHCFKIEINFSNTPIRFNEPKLYSLKQHSSLDHFPLKYNMKDSENNCVINSLKNEQKTIKEARFVLEIEYKNVFGIDNVMFHSDIQPIQIVKTN